MDPVLSSILPSNRIGNDGFNWWIGQVEQLASQEENNKGGYRAKVRIIGDHPGSKKILDTSQLPWATMMMPVNVPFMPGNIGGGHHGLVVGCWVVGFYLDPERQKPIIMGSIGNVPGATTKVINVRPTDGPFTNGTRYGDLAPIPALDGQESPENRQGGPSQNTANTGGGLSDGTKRKDGKPRVPVPPRIAAGLQQEKWCQSVAEKCKEQDLKTQMTFILGQFLADIQNSGGNVGDFYVNKATGELNSAIFTGRKYVNKAISVVTELLAHVKGYIKKLLQKGVDKLIKAILKPDEKGNSLTPVTKWFNEKLKDLGCKMEDLGTRLMNWLTNVLMSFINKAYRAAVCLVDEFVNGIISKINQLLDELLSSVLGPLQAILGVIAKPLNLIGQAVSFVLKLLGISCSGPDRTCATYKQICTNGAKKKKKNDKDFLDGLLSGIDKLFGDTPADYTQYTCEEAYTGRPLEVTTIGFTGGIPLPGGSSGGNAPTISYSVADIVVTEGENAVFTITRSGYLEEASSIVFTTLDDQSTATAELDYLSDSGIIGFQPGEETKEISFRTFADSIEEEDEYFYISLSQNSPDESSGIKSVFINNIARCTITERDATEDYDPYLGAPVNPEYGIDDVFPPDSGLDEEDLDGDGVPDNQDPSIDVFDVVPSYKVTTDKSNYKEGEFVVYTIKTTNIPNGTILYYNLFGNDITEEDIVGASLSGSFVITDNTGKVTVGIEEDDVVEKPETLRFVINGTGAFADVLIVPVTDRSLEDYNTGVGETPENRYREFEFPTIDDDNIITDDNGGIIEIPISNPGDPWAEPPFIFIDGEGYGATATGLLDENGFLSEIRITSNGYGYKKNLASDKGVRCIIDSFTILRPGTGYTEKPDMYVNGELGIAEAIINPDGLVIGAVVLDRAKYFDEFPEIDIIGGGGYGAQLLPSLACLDSNRLEIIGSTKIGTGRYIDCP